MPNWKRWKIILENGIEIQITYNKKIMKSILYHTVNADESHNSHFFKSI